MACNRLERMSSNESFDVVSKEMKEFNDQLFDLKLKTVGIAVALVSGALLKAVKSEEVDNHYFSIC